MVVDLVHEFGQIHFEVIAAISRDHPPISPDLGLMRTNSRQVVRFPSPAIGWVSFPLMDDQELDTVDEPGPRVGLGRSHATLRLHVARDRPGSGTERRRITDSPRQDVADEARERGGWKIVHEGSTGRRSSPTAKPASSPGSMEAERKAGMAHCPPTGARTEGIAESGNAGRPEQSAPEQGAGREGGPASQGIASAPAWPSRSSLAISPPAWEREVTGWVEQSPRADDGKKKPSVGSARNAPIQGFANRPRIESLIPPRKLVEQLRRGESFLEVDSSGATVQTTMKQ